MNSPARTYFFSDTYGGQEEHNPLAAPDADVLISTDFGSLADSAHREFDIFGAEQVTDHLLRLIIQQHDEIARRTDLTRRQRADFAEAGTGVFINSAPRINRSNGEPFYVATLRGGAIRIVTTPLSALSAVRDDVETLAYLPNPQSEGEHNGLYSHREQFRSRLTPVLLRTDTQLSLTPLDPQSIPEYQKPWHVAYIDRFGNIITWTEDAERQWNEILRVGDEMGQTRDRIALTIGGTAHDVKIGSSLGQAEPGQVSVYRNGNIDLVRKWAAADTPRERLRLSAYILFDRPRIGDPCGIAHPESR